MDLATSLQMQQAMLTLTAILNFGDKKVLKHMADLASRNVGIMKTREGEKVCYAIADACTEMMEERE